MLKGVEFRRGQAVVLALLLMAVVLTVGLAVISQSVVDISTSTQSQEVVSAYTAAEAGIEQALRESLALGSEVDIPSGTVGKAVFVARTSLLGGGYSFVLPRTMVGGDSQTLWFASHGTDGSLVCDSSHQCFKWGSDLSSSGLAAVVYWGNSGTSEVPAVLVDIYYKKTVPVISGYSDVAVYRIALDPNPSRGNSFTSGGVETGDFSVAGGNFRYKYNLVDAFEAIQANSPGAIQQNGGLLMSRVILLYASNPQSVGFDFAAANSVGSQPLPRQGFVPESQGSVGTSATIRLTSTYPYPDAPNVFDYAVYSSQASIIK